MGGKLTRWAVLWSLVSFGCVPRTTPAYAAPAPVTDPHEEERTRAATKAERDRKAAESTARVNARREQIFQEIAPIRKESRVFSVPQEDGDAAWARAQIYLSNHSSMKLQIATDFVLETYAPVGVSFGYQVTRKPDGGGYSFEVKALGPSDKASIDILIVSTEKWFEMMALTQRNAAIAAHYIRTGELVCERCIAK